VLGMTHLTIRHSRKSHRVSGRTHVVEEVIPCHFEEAEGISSPKPYFTNWSKSVG